MSRTLNGYHVSNYAEHLRRSKRLASALSHWGVQFQERLEVHLFRGEFFLCLLLTYWIRFILYIICVFIVILVSIFQLGKILLSYLLRNYISIFQPFTQLQVIIFFNGLMSLGSNKDLDLQDRVATLMWNTGGPGNLAEIRSLGDKSLFKSLRRWMNN